MRIKKKLFLFVMFLVMVFILSSCGIIPQSPEGKISGRVLIPPSEISKDITGWVPTANAEVTIVDAIGITHTATTDENGYYAFLGIAVNPNTIITATVELNGDTLILKDVIPQAVTADEDYDAGDMDPESTALALLIEALIAAGEDPSDIDIDEIKSSDDFLALVSQVTSVLEEDGDITEDPDIANMIEDIINPPVPPSPSPTPKPDTTITIAALPGVTAPVALATPVTAITETSQYTGTVSWTPPDNPFDYSTVYTATITLTAKEGYTITGVTESFFTVTGATTNNPADSGVITAVFPATEAGTGPIYNQTKNTYYNTIQAAIDDSTPDDEIVVSAGTYYENIVIDNKKITLKSTDPADPATVAATIIDGQDQDSVVKILNGDTSILEGFTIQNGNEPDYGGGGIFISGSSPIIRYNIIGDKTDDGVDTGNTGYCGGGICVVDGSIEPHIYQNKIIGNKGYYGGGMFIGYGSPLVENNIIKDNVSDDEGGGIIVVYSKKEGNSYCPTISNNIIEYNKTTNASGGGIVVDEEGSAIIENNQINNNETNFHGGGILIILNSDADIREGNIIEDNKAGRHGGGIYIDSKGIISITSNTINNNRANIASGPYSGGGIYVEYSSPTIGGDTFTDTDNFNTICGNIPDQVDPDNYPNNDYCYFTFDSTSRTITDYNTSGGLDVNIPSAIGGVPVEHIGDQAFSSKGLKSIIIPDSVTSIGRYAFYTNELDEVTIPDSVTTIDYGAFNTNLLTSINFGNSVTDIGGYAFFNNALTSVTIPDNVKTIGSFSPHDGYTFANNQLTSINLGNSVATLGYGVFEGNKLTSVTIPNSVTTICDDAFKSNTLTSVIIGDGVYIVDSYSDTMGTNVGFRTAYTSGGGGAGTYNYTDGAWVKE